MWILKVILVLSFAWRLPVARGESIPPLGSGYQLAGDQVTAPCLVGAPVWRGQETAQLTFHWQRSLEQLLDEHGGGIGGGINLGIIGGSVHADYLSRVATSDQQISLIFDNKISMGNLSLEERSLSSEGLAAARLSEKDAYYRCGDAFVTTIRYGAQLFINMSFHGKDKDSLKRFKTTVTVTALFGLIKSSKTFTEETKAYHDTVTFEVFADQKGGQPLLLDRLTGGSAVHCTLRAPEPCLKRFDELMTYAKSPTGFMAQLRGSDRQLHPTAMQTATYLESGHEALGGKASLSAPNRWSFQILELWNSEKLKAAHLRYLEETQQADLETIKTASAHIKDNLTQIENAAIKCRQCSEAECEAVYQNLRQNLIQINLDQV